MSYTPNNPNGSATSANFAPVVIASDNTGPVVVTDGTNKANTLKSDGTSVGQNALLTGGTGYTTATVSLSAGTQNSS